MNECLDLCLGEESDSEIEERRSDSHELRNLSRGRPSSYAGPGSLPRSHHRSISSSRQSELPRYPEPAHTRSSFSNRHEGAAIYCHNRPTNKKGFRRQSSVSPINSQRTKILSSNYYHRSIRLPSQHGTFRGFYHKSLQRSLAFQRRSNVPNDAVAPYRE